MREIDTDYFQKQTELPDMKVPLESVCIRAQETIFKTRDRIHNSIQGVQLASSDIKERLDEQFFDKALVYAAPVIMPAINFGIHLTQAKDNYSTDEMRCLKAGAVILLVFGAYALTRRRKSTACHGEDHLGPLNSDEHRHKFPQEVIHSRPLRGTKQDLPETKGGLSSRN